MAFKLMRELVFKWPVKVMEPDPDAPGQYVEKTFTAIMAIIDPEKVKASNEKRLQILSENAIEKDFAKLKKLQARLAKHDEDAMREVLRGWEDLLDENDKPLPYNAETFRLVHGIDRVRIALQAAYAEAISQDRARLGN